MPFDAFRSPINAISFLASFEAGVCTILTAEIYWLSSLSATLHRSGRRSSTSADYLADDGRHWAFTLVRHSKNDSNYRTHWAIGPLFTACRRSLGIQHWNSTFWIQRWHSTLAFNAGIQHDQCGYSTMLIFDLHSRCSQSMFTVNVHRYHSTALECTQVDSTHSQSLGVRDLLIFWMRRSPEKVSLSCKWGPLSDWSLENRFLFRFTVACESLHSPGVPSVDAGNFRPVDDIDRKESLFTKSVGTFVYLLVRAMVTQNAGGDAVFRRIEPNWVRQNVSLKKVERNTSR